MGALTDKTLASLKRKPADAGTTYDVADGIVPGLFARVSPKGRVSFILYTRYPGSESPSRRTIAAYDGGNLAKVRTEARHWLQLISEGKDPADVIAGQKIAAERRKANSFRAVAEDFIKEKLAHERKGREVEADIRREFLPIWNGRPISEIDSADVVAIVKAAKNRGATYQAHNLLGTARRLFSWAIDQHCYGLESSPCDRLKPKAIIGKKLFRTRVLNDDELRALWKATETMPYPYGPLFRMLALTGQRKSEVAEARWSEFDLSRKLWTIPAERMKADSPHVVPLSDDVAVILKSLPRFERGEHLFSTTFGRAPVNGFSKAKVMLDKAMGAILGSFEPFVIHDIRRTMRTGLSALPAVSSDVAELVIAHTRPGLRKVYDQYAFEVEKRKALELWAGRLRDITTPPPANVLRLETARA
jgi:integrase